MCDVGSLKLGSPEAVHVCVQFLAFFRGQNRTHARVVARFHLQNRAHARVLALFDAQKWPKRARERDSAGGIALKRARECDSDLKSVPEGPKTVQNRTRGIPKPSKLLPRGRFGAQVVKE